MTLRLYDTAARSAREFVPLEPGKASIYLCGMTVQGPPHIGHTRNWVTTDILRRWLEHSGLRVTLVRNVTDIDDKILIKAAESGEPWWALGYRYERAVREAEVALGCLPPTYEPRATGHITEMIALMQRLIDSGHAYASGGDVFFDVASLPSYGSLSGQRIDQMHPAHDSAGDARKRDARDFALWKGTKPGEPATASWATPWGPGRPGWHLECSAMATKYLGGEFDIHCGGLDLVFPHHENELAQSRAAGDGFARYWLHNAMLNLSGEKMSKSLGNVLGVDELTKRWRPVELRYFLGCAHYRSTMEFSSEAVDEAAAAYRRIENFVERAIELVGDSGGTPGSRDGGTPTSRGAAGGGVVPGRVSDAFGEAMDDDLGVPAALAALFAVVNAGNSAIAAGDSGTVRGSLAAVLAMTDVLGINPLSWREAASSDLTAVVDALVRVALDQRAAARARKDYAAADAVRDQLTEAGIAVEDTASGPRWTLKDHQ